MQGVDNSTFENITIRNPTTYGFWLNGQFTTYNKNLVIKNIDILGSNLGAAGLYFDQFTYNNSIKDISVSNLGIGVKMRSDVLGNILDNITTIQNNYGFHISGTNNNTIANSTSVNNSYYNLRITNSQNNTIYNNLLGNISKVYSSNWTQSKPNFFNNSLYGNWYYNTSGFGLNLVICFDSGINSPPKNCDYKAKITDFNGGGISPSSSSNNNVNTTFFPVINEFSYFLFFLIIALGFIFF